MNQTKLDNAKRGLSSIAKKVYDALPLNSHWTATQVAQEMHRLGTCGRPDLHIIRGCINTLIESGLAIENEQNRFCRLPVREKCVAPPNVVPIHPTTPPEPPIMRPIALAEKPPAPAIEKLKPVSLLDVMSSVAKRAAALAGELNCLALDIESAALDAAVQLEVTEQDLVKYRQLQSLLKGMGA